MYVDYRALNWITVRDRFPIPLILDLLDQLGKAAIVSKIDLCLGYWQVRVTDSEVRKMAFLTRYGSYEFMFLPFGLTSEPMIFCRLMNQVLV